MQSNPVGWFEIYVQDMPRAKRFYESVLGVGLSPLETPGGEPKFEMVSFPMQENVPGAPGALVKMEGFEPSGGGVMVYFTCEDCADEVGRVASAGGSVHREKFSIGEHGFIALAIDTEGNMFGLHSMK